MIVGAGDILDLSTHNIFIRTSGLTILYRLILKMCEFIELIRYLEFVAMDLHVKLRI
jgi:hypothetical protein